MQERGKQANIIRRFIARQRHPGVSKEAQLRATIAQRDAKIEELDQLPHQDHRLINPRDPRKTCLTVGGTAAGAMLLVGCLGIAALKPEETKDRLYDIGNTLIPPTLFKAPMGQETAVRQGLACIITDATLIDNTRIAERVPHEPDTALMAQFPEHDVNMRDRAADLYCVSDSEKNRRFLQQVTQKVNPQIKEFVVFPVVTRKAE